MPDEHPLATIWRSAGFPTASAFAEACGLSPSEISRIVSPGSTRRPSARHIRAIAATLGKTRAEIARLVLPEKDPEGESLREVLDERDALMRDLSAARQELLETRAARDAVSEQLKLLTRKLGDEIRQREHVTDVAARAKAALHAVQGELAASRKLLAERDVERSRLQQNLEQQRQLVEKTREEAAKELARAVEQIRGLQDDATKARVRSVERQILSGAIGAVAGAIITRAGMGRDASASDRAACEDEPEGEE